MADEMYEHQPVLLDKALEMLNIQPGNCVVDATLGLGGHAQALLEACGTSGHLVGFDRDPVALKMAEQRLASLSGRATCVHRSFGELANTLEELGIEAVDAVLMDLGVSSMQLDNAERGFSFQRKGPLDMRMDLSQEQTAAALVNTSDAETLQQILIAGGEGRWARRIARAIVENRPFEDTEALAQVIRRAVPRAPRKIDSATCAFQAIRIAVNQEFEQLEAGLDQAIQKLAPGGRLAVMAYHSLEDRIVKVRLREAASEGMVELLTKKPICVDDTEKQANKRSRSVRLRVAEKKAL